MFKRGEYIHYATNGLCRVDDITTLGIPGADPKRLYYRLTPLDGRGSTVYTPVDNRKVGMRRALTKEEANTLIDKLPQVQILDISDDKQRESAYKEALATTDCLEWAKVIKTLYVRRKKRIDQGKKVTATEERYYQTALDRLNSEIALAMDIDRDGVESYMISRLGTP